MFKFGKKEQSDDADFLDLTEKVINLSAENKKLADERDALAQQNQGLQGSLDAVVEGNGKLSEKYTSMILTVGTMLAALKLAEQYTNTHSDQGRLDKAAIRNAIAEGEKSL